MTPETLTIEYLRTPPSVVALLWVLFALFALGLVANIAQLVKVDPLKPSSRRAMGIATVIHVGLVIWIAVTLWGAR